MQLCAITDGERLSDTVELAKDWAAAGVDFIQLREKDLDATQLAFLARQILGQIDRSLAKLLVNVSTLELAEVALAVGADGIHLAGKPSAGAASSLRRTFPDIIISVPCHSLEDVAIAREEQVDLLLFSPIFEKLSGQPQGLEALSRACTAAQGIPVFALGGVTAANASDCLAAGAAGVAGIRLFAGERWRQLIAAKARYIVE